MVSTVFVWLFSWCFHDAVAGAVVGVLVLLGIIGLVLFIVIGRGLKPNKFVNDRDEALYQRENDKLAKKPDSHTFANPL